jgi:hypothetical protein
MEPLTFKEKFDLWRVKNSFGFCVWCPGHKHYLCSLYDCGIYYLVAVVLKNTQEKNWVNLTRSKRKFLSKMSKRLQVKDFPLGYILRRVVENSLYLEKWKKWVAVFIDEYEKTFDFILASEQQQADLVLRHRKSLIDIINCVDETEEYEDVKSATSAFKIAEMLEASINVSKILDSTCYRPAEHPEEEISSETWGRKTIIDFSQDSLRRRSVSPCEENTSMS